ncbi:MAG: bifunctional pyr operon transcriptional regulator/uracil phosphoribosyltransferase PyrR [marine benthic group bacterium]|jgi:pyrimidine operon attenuation protein/uracil phosphoribosyltransferase|nr:bifunctional pyr operon transcriptional regulator/uracil phosphoribosyltransferase PyrR [Gemmatimonadota bacterium]MCL7962859.1 bifunctional pyr operon transcriptional regulator/uracil phosphoribosyltransferase PyrR [Candidatus Carthagonibacter metallireducens]MCL7938192.1 bifunctional pyr operon transcriptional regulator/uracil phosphoribosyltransferase PyrR [Gemmatimonadota bacterium]MCL7956856.1 bifunctional pyr operon transcriptional regulator/uracil phosphoribosyltransferase PyrR [Gemmat
MTPDDTQQVLDARGVDDALVTLATEIADGGAEGLLLVGIRRRGVQLAARLAEILERTHGIETPTGSLDITLYRDDLHQIGPMPVIGMTEIPTEITGARVVIVDDVLFTGRTIRAALQELADFGRPRKIELCVLVDRGGRELPIQADYVGIKIEAGERDLVEVRVPELDGDSSVTLVSATEAK